MMIERRSSQRRWLAPAAGVAVAVLLLVASTRIASHQWSGSVAVRRIEPRLSGSSTWSPFRGGPPREEGAVAWAAVTPVAVVRGAPGSGAQYKTGVEQLLAGQTREALASLTTAAETLNTPAAWNDLSVAYHEAALRYDAPQLLADAVTAADRALSLDPAFAEALFNRALMIERLGLRTDARKAWSRYLEVDPASGWAAEAQAHLGALPPERPFMAVLDDEYDRVANDPVFAASLVNSDPFGARGMGIKEVLGRWGVATLSGNEQEANRHLSVARALSVGVTQRGDHTLERAIATIDAADDRSRGVLASAHADYQAGISAFMDTRPVDAEPLLRRAAAGFARTGSPVMIPALLFAANTAYEQGRHDDAEQQHQHLLATTSEDYPAYRAFMTWQLGICRRSRADWGGAITYFEQSAALFEHIGETQNLKIVHCLVAFVYDRIGDRESAWHHRIAVLRLGGPSSALVYEKTTSAIAERALKENDWHKAASFLTLHADVARRDGDETLLAETLFVRAVVRDQLQDKTGTRADLAEAKLAVARIRDPGYMAAMSIAEMRAIAMLSDTLPGRAEALLTQALQYRSTEPDPPRLPDLLLQRARARRNLGKIADALEDIERGIADLEADRKTLPEGEIRWGAFHGAEELFDEGVDLAMTTGHPEMALGFAERARARVLLDIYGRSPIVDYRRLPPRTVVVEYAALASRLVIFTADANGIRAKSVDCTRDTLARDVDAFGKALGLNQIGEPAHALYRRLIDPIAPELLDARTIVFVPDATTSTIAFSALVDGHGALLIRDHGVVIAPSVAAFTAMSERRGTARPADALLISASAATNDLAPLRSANREAAGISDVYRNPTRIAEDADQFDELVRRAPEADVIHFAGHAVGDDTGLEPASIVLRQNGRARRVSVPEIAKLRLRPSAVVVLAGCNTARGERRAAAGVSSVAYGFLSAGAAAVIATLGPIDDDVSARFFPRVHQRLAAGMSAAEALRGAQLESIERGDVPVSLWAAVQNIGS